MLYCVVFQVIKLKIAEDKELHQNLVEVISPGEREETKSILQDTAAVLIRKYTHARIGGFVKGEYDQAVEKSGGRSKGGAGLRDKLYSLSGQTGKRGRGRGQSKKDKKGK